MIKESLQTSINGQINAELYSAYLYASMEQYFASLKLKGFANWMHVQVQEESAHAIRFANYINDNSGRVIFTAIDAPPVEWDSPLQVFEEVYKHEQKVTSLINGLVQIARQENDDGGLKMLEWFVKEQVEEEENAEEIVNMLKTMDGTEEALASMDRKLAGRVFVDPNA